MLGVLWGRAELLEKLKPYRVETNKDVLPGKFEMGMLNNASLASLEAALEYLLWLDGLVSGPASVTGDRGSRFRSVMTAIADYEKGLTRRVLEGFREFAPDRFRCFGIADPSRSGERVPTFAFEIAGIDGHGDEEEALGRGRHPDRRRKPLFGRRLPPSRPPGGHLPGELRPL